MSKIIGIGDLQKFMSEAADGDYGDASPVVLTLANEAQRLRLKIAAAVLICQGDCADSGKLRDVTALLHKALH
jgi:hypothetical protein